MHILENPTELAPIGGVEMSMLQVAEQLSARGHTISALYQTPGPHLPRWQALADTLRQVPSFECRRASLLSDLRRLPPAVRAAQEISPDVVYLNRAEQMVWGLLASRASGAPLVVHLRTHLHFPGVRLAGRLATRFVAVSGFVRDHWIRAGVPAEKVTVVHNGVDPAAYPAGGMVQRTAARAALGLPADAYVVLYYGRISPGKGVPTLLDAWSAMALPQDSARLVIVGAAPQEQAATYESALRNRAVAGTHWLPGRSDVTSALHAADVVVLPAEWQEPFGRVVIEGMASGRPVVATRVGGIPEILTGEFAEMLVDPADPVGLARRLRRLSTWRDEDPELARRCTGHVAQNFSLAATADGVERALARAVGASATDRLPELGLR